MPEKVWELHRRDAVRPASEDVVVAAGALRLRPRDPETGRYHPRGVLTAAEAVAIVELEDQLSLVDEAISSLGQRDPHSTADAREAVFLWSHRVELLDALVEARGVPRSRGNIVYASAERR